MSNVEQTLRLLRELDRIDRQGAPEEPPAPVPTAAVLSALEHAGFDLYAAIASAHDDA
ncbi:hypothetical protein [Cellulomonas sp. KRMCY2]|uniref:hypothetical protein n=1 Tax=Cellulomonas sp. KRMCY2 TaxID=1304865 RepID=UPI0012DD51D4|nr:hypothetical protein [Cellulomonas sp. KRMCY2]